MHPGGLSAVRKGHWFAMSFEKCEWFCAGIVNTGKSKLFLELSS